MTVMTMPAGAITQVPLSFRKSVDWLRGPQLDTLRCAYAASMSISDERGFDYWAGLHGLPLPMYCQHHTDLFLPWHRAYLYFFELSLKSFEPTVSLPWWDWTSADAHAYGLPRAYADDGGGEWTNPLAGGRIGELARQSDERVPERTFRQPDEPWRLPTGSDLEDILSLTDFLDFSHQLEKVHDSVHIWIGGTVAEIPFAAYDPIFWAHHTTVDRIWRLWQLRHPAAGMPGWLLSTPLQPFSITVADTLSTTDLGYDYAVFSSRTLIGSSP